jgi:hypothetical protein
MVHPRASEHVDAGMTLRAARLPGVPIQDKGLQVVASASLMLPAIGPKGATYHIELMLAPRGDEKVNSHVAAVEYMGAGQQITCGAIMRDRRAHHTIQRGLRRREHVGDQTRLA